MAKLRTADDAYAEPANVLEIDITDPQTHGFGSKRYTDYAVKVRTNLPIFALKESQVSGTERVRVSHRSCPLCLRHRGLSDVFIILLSMERS